MALFKIHGRTSFDYQLVSYISQMENEKAQSFLDEIEDPCNLKNNAGETLLHIASKCGNSSLTKYLIDLGFEVDARDKFGVTPLALAVQYRHKHTIKILLGANADIYDSDYRTCPLQVIHSAYMKNRRSRNNIPDIWKMFACKVLADYSKDKRATGTKLWNSKCSLQFVVMVIGGRILLRYYIKNGYDINTPEPSSQCTALHAAIESNHISAVKELVENGADINALDRQGRTPLCYYNCYSKESSIKLQMLEYLIDNGASFTLFSSAEAAEAVPLLYFDSLEHLLSRGNVETVKIVLRSNIDLMAADRFGMTPLHFLANNKFPGVMSALEGKSFEVDARDKNGNTPLMLAILKNKNVSSIEFLLNNGADVNAENNVGKTPLCCLASCALKLRDEKLRKITVEICKVLLQRRANIQHVFKICKKKKKKVINEQIITIFDIITERKKFEISELLLAQLVLNNVLHHESITDLIRSKIESNEALEEQFNACNQQIEKMKAARINESLTLFDLMTAKAEDLLVYAVDFEFLSKIDDLLSSAIGESSYYEEIIKKRIGDVVKNLKSAGEVKVEKVAAQSTCCIS